MTSMDFPTDIVSDITYGFSHRHQWFFTEILYFYMTSMIFPIDIVFIYDIAGFSHRYRMTSMILPIDIVFFCDIYLISPYISYFYMSSTCFPPYDINGFSHRYVFLYDIDGFSHRFRIWYDINGFAHRYRVLIWHRWFFT